MNLNQSQNILSLRENNLLFSNDDNTNQKENINNNLEKSKEMNEYNDNNNIDNEKKMIKKFLIYYIS